MIDDDSHDDSIYCDIWADSTVLTFPFIYSRIILWAVGFIKEDNKWQEQESRAERDIQVNISMFKATMAKIVNEISE